MTNSPLTLSSEECVRLLNAFNSADGVIEAAAKLLDDMPASTYRRQLKVAKKWAEENGHDFSTGRMGDLANEIKILKTRLATQERDEMTREAVRRKILKLADAEFTQPNWTVRPSKKNGITGVPTLMLSDFHWGEKVRASEIGGVNEFNLEIAHKRLNRLLEVTHRLLFKHIADPKYDGLVLNLGGDLVSGTIHEELTITNEAPIMSIVLDMLGALIEVIDHLLEWFSKILINGVAGNHGRLTRKPVAKERAQTNWDWLICCLLESHYASEAKAGHIVFNIPDGPDANYRIYARRYLLTHGDQFRGGDGMIGPLGPLTRGRHKKQSRRLPEFEFDTMVVGHFHQLMQLPHLIVNGSIKGYDEYAMQNNFTWEEPSQALWITHPKGRIIHQMPIYVDDIEAPSAQPWASVLAG